MIKLKSLLTEGRERSHCWISPSGKVIPVKDTHDMTARKIFPNEADPMMLLWKKGYLRVTWMYDGSLIVNNEAIRLPNEKQISVLKDIAIEGEHSKVEFDNGKDRPKILWSEFDILQEDLLEVLAGITNYDDRIRAGKGLEANVLNNLRNMGYKIKDPTAQQDKFDKIDGWWVGKGGKEYPLQVKVRETGDDVLFELMSDLDRNKLGRDMVSSAILYVVKNRSGKTRMFRTDDLKQTAKKILNDILKDIQKEPNKTRWTGGGWEAKIQIDRADGRKKLLAYFNPLSFNPIAEWDFNY